MTAVVMVAPEQSRPVAARRHWSTVSRRIANPNTGSPDRQGRHRELGRRRGWPAVRGSAGGVQMTAGVARPPKDRRASRALQTGVQCTGSAQAAKALEMVAADRAPALCALGRPHPGEPAKEGGANQGGGWQVDHLVPPWWP